MAKFETIGEICADPVFRKQVHIALEDLKGKRRNRPDPDLGRHYRRDWYDRMSMEELSSAYFLDNIAEIWAKTSSLNSEYRGVIKYVCDIAFHNTMVHYAAIEKEASTKEISEPVTPI